MMLSPADSHQWIPAFVCLFVPMLTTAMIACPPCKCTNALADCSGLNLKQIPRLPPPIRILNFSNNCIGNLTSDKFSNIRGIITLNLGNNSIHDVAKDTFDRLHPDLVDLDISNNQLSSPTKVFRALASTQLKYLNLSNTALHFSDFSKLDPLSNVPLRILYLQGNYLKILKGNLTGSLPKLQKLVLTENFITKISFVDIHEELKILDIDDNLLTAFPSFCLKKDITTSALPGLQTLSLSLNFITTLSGLNESKSCLQNLKRLILDNNHFFEFGDNSFSGLPKLQTLSLGSVTNQRLSIHQAAFNSTSLQSLTLGSSQRKIIVQDKLLKLFHFCRNLTSLRLFGVSFYKWKQGSMRELFSPLQKLTYLTLVNTDITLIPTLFLPRMENLVYLESRKNLISSWHSSVFKYAKALKTLILSNNQITHLNETFFPDFLWKNLEMLDLALNPFDCSCELYWFRKWLNDNSNKIKTYPKNYFCKSPSKYKDKHLIDYDPSYRECHPLPTLTIALIVCACVLVVLAIVAVIIYRNRWHIKYYIYLLRVKQGYQPIPDNDSFRYDAFVAYNSTDRVWVISKLREFLENQHDMKLCLHERDFNAGKLIVDNIVENIRLSRKVILILSDEFAKSQWCQFETLMAQNRFFEQGASSLVLIMLEGVSSSHMNGPLSLLLQSMTYIQWSRDPLGKELFWNKLLESLR